MNSEFRGAVALVTGAASGIGLALAQALAREGARVALTDADPVAVRESAAAIAATGGRIAALPLDVTSRSEWDTAVRETERALGPIDILCSNAGCNSCRLPLVEMPPDYMRWLFDVNVFGAVHGIQAIVPGMIRRGRGRVLFTGSMAGLASSPMGADYSGTKHALLAIAESLREETRQAGIAVSYFCPAAVPSNLARSTRRHLDPALAARLPEKAEAGEAEKRKALAESGGYIPADAAADLALEGLREGRFFIPTHPDSGGRAQARHEQFLAALAALARSETGR